MPRPHEFAADYSSYVYQKKSKFNSVASMANECCIQLVIFILTRGHLKFREIVVVFFGVRMMSNPPQTRGGMAHKIDCNFTMLGAMLK